MKTKEIRENLRSRALVLIKSEAEDQAVRATEQMQKNKKNFRLLMKEKLDVDIGSNRNSLEMDFEDMMGKFTIFYCRNHFYLQAKSTCGACGKTRNSYPIYCLTDLARVMAGKNWGYHTCNPPKSENQPTIEQRTFNLIEELFDLFYHEREER